MPGNRISVKIVKKLGKYFFQKLTNEEHANWMKDVCGVRPEIKTDKQLIEFALQVKALGKDFKDVSCV